MAVVSRLQWPSSACTVRISVPVSSKCVANECRLCRVRHKRHAFATRMLRQGHPLKVIADLLGHRALASVAIYAKVDLPHLAQVAADWPEVAR
jgi:site-specific recombinase XerC